MSGCMLNIIFKCKNALSLKDEGKLLNNESKISHIKFVYIRFACTQCEIARKKYGLNHRVCVCVIILQYIISPCPWKTEMSSYNNGS